MKGFFACEKLKWQTVGTKWKTKSFRVSFHYRQLERISRPENWLAEASRTISLSQMSQEMKYTAENARQF
jgi:hypothetical protein